MAKTLRLEGVFPLELDALWELLHAHIDESRLREVHPWILDGRTTREGEPVEFNGRLYPREKVAERVVKVGVRRARTTWRYRIDPPVRYLYDIAFENGSLTRLDNTYSPAEGGTLVRTLGEVSIKRVPSSIATWLVRRSLNRTEDEDLAYARKVGL